MVNGTLRCLGTTMHIKSKYGNGYHLELLLDLNKNPIYDTETIEHKIMDSLAKMTQLTNLVVMEKAVFSKLRMKLVLGLGNGAGQKIRLGRIFQWCNNDSMEIIEDYALGQPTLEQVFLKFAKQQEEIDEGQEGGGNPPNAGGGVSQA